MVNAVLLNDTSKRYHHGCSRVSRIIKNGLQEQGVDLIATSFAHKNWKKNQPFLKSLEKAQLIIINGEGTLHNGAKSGHHLLSIVDHPLVEEKPIALINSIWENNPDEWLELLERFSLVSVRDSNSLNNLKHSGFDKAFVVPDLSLSESLELPSSDHFGLLVGDSVKSDIRYVLARYCQRMKATFLPTKFLANAFWNWTFPKKILWMFYNGVFTGQIPSFKMATNEHDYAVLLSKSSGHVTGRFHGICYSILTEVPFLAVSSVTSKIATLLVDAGVNNDRLLGKSCILENESKVPPAFTSTELKNMRNYRALAKFQAQKLFEQIANLAQ